AVDVRRAPAAGREEPFLARRDQMSCAVRVRCTRHGPCTRYATMSQSGAGGCMERQMRFLGMGVLLTATMLAGCDEMSRTVNDAVAREEADIEAQDRLEQQLGDIPANLDTTAAARLSGAFRAAAA